MGRPTVAKWDTDDAILRAAIKAALVERHSHESDVVIVEELPTARASARFDLAVVNGHLHGFEIKSDRDTLTRLPRQAEFFSASMHRMTLVAGERHVDAAAAIVPDWWGLVEAIQTSKGVRLRNVRRGRLNRRLDSVALVEMLERDEIVAILTRNRIDRGMRTASYSDLVEYTARKLRVRALANEVRHELKFRAAWEASYCSTKFGRDAVCLRLVDRLRPATPAVSCVGSP